MQQLLETFQMIKHRESTFICSFPQRFGSLVAAATVCILIESTYAQLM
jgi:hypothetical protein